MTSMNKNYGRLFGQYDRQFERLGEKKKVEVEERGVERENVTAGFESTNNYSSSIVTTCGEVR